MEQEEMGEPVQGVEEIPGQGPDVPGDATGPAARLLLRGVERIEVGSLVHDDMVRQLRQGPGSPAGCGRIAALRNVEELTLEQRIVLGGCRDPPGVEGTGLVIDDPVASGQVG
jgi:hypothetical protein